jgi:nucleotide-binding universal stress UspA family protein
MACVAAFERLLVPVDFSPASRVAFDLAMSMAEVWGSQVVLFNAAGVDGNDEFLDHTGVPWGRGDVLAEACEQLRAFAEAVVPGSAAKVRVDATRDEDPVRAVAQACERHTPSFVVLGTHQRDRRGWRRSRAERMVRELSCPVMLVPGERQPQVDPDT